MGKKTESGKNAVQSRKQVAVVAAHRRGAGPNRSPAKSKSRSRALAPRPVHKGFLALSPQAATLPAVRTIQPPPVQREVMTEAKILEAFDAMGITAKLDEQKKKLFLAVAREFQLNPLRREIHAVKMGGGDDEEGGGMLVPVVGYEVYIDRAEETERLEYWYLEEAGEIDPNDWRKSTYLVTLAIKRRDWPKEFRWSVRYTEAVGLRWDKAKRCHEVNSMWRKRGHFMTQKCAIGQGFRLVFREILRGMPYIDAEIEGAENGQEHLEDKRDLRPPQALPSAATPTVLPAPAPASAEAPAAAPAAKPEAPAPGPYGQIMTTISEKVKSKEGPTVALFNSTEKMEWKVKADMVRGNPEELQGVLQELEGIAGPRRKQIKGEV